jgi:GNAT superfamily N-acetyltransferase
MHRTVAELLPGDAWRIEEHLLRLSPEDRSMRFGAGVVTDASLRAYVGRIRFGHDIVLGLLSQRGGLFGLAHGCVYDHRGQVHVEAAFSVDAPWRGQGLGHALMAAVRLRASALDCDLTVLVGLCAARNWPMRRVFEGGGLELQREDGDIHARGWVPGTRALR